MTYQDALLSLYFYAKSKPWETTTNKGRAGVKQSILYKFHNNVHKEHLNTIIKKEMMIAKRNPNSKNNLNEWTFIAPEIRSYFKETNTIVRITLKNPKK